MKKSNLQLTDAEIQLIKLKGQLGLLRSQAEQIMNEMVLVQLKKKIKKLLIQT